MAIKKNKEERKQFFKDLYNNCSKEDVYSVIETAEGMGISYEQVLKWADKNKGLNNTLQECRAMCAEHASNASPSDSLSWMDIQQYIMENDDAEVTRYAEFQEKERLRKEEERKARELKEQEEKEKNKVIAIQLKGIQADDLLKATEAISETIYPVKAEDKKNLLTELEKKNESSQQELIANYLKKFPDENLKFTFNKNAEKSTDEKNVIEAQHHDKKLTPFQQAVLESATLSAATGTASSKVGARLLAQTESGLFKGPYDAAHSINTTQEALLAMAPNDIYEGQLCSRLVVLQNQAMEFMCRAANPEASTEMIDLNINRATKLSRLYNETLEALNKHRRKGEQKVNVTHQHNHVNVGDGGQAVVAGQLNQTGGGDHDKK